MTCDDGDNLGNRSMARKRAYHGVKALAVAVGVICGAGASAFANNPATSSAHSMVEMPLMAENPVYGEWVSPMGDAVIALQPCGDNLCGHVVNQDFAPAVETDVLNPDPAQWDRPIIGLRILDGLEMSGRDRWKGGVFYDPRTGKSYMPKIKVLSDDQVKISGCIGPGLCKGYVWNRDVPSFAQSPNEQRTPAQKFAANETAPKTDHVINSVINNDLAPLRDTPAAPAETGVVEQKPDVRKPESPISTANFPNDAMFAAPSFDGAEFAQ